FYTLFTPFNWSSFPGALYSANIDINASGNNNDFDPLLLTIDNSQVIAHVIGDGSSYVDLSADGNGENGSYTNSFVNIQNKSTVSSIVDAGVRKATLRIYSGDINILDSKLNAIQTGDGIGDIYMQAAHGSILDNKGSLISANSLGMVAKNNIGTAEDPINTAVDTLMAYSSGLDYDGEGSSEGELGQGSIYINEKDALEVGYFVESELQVWDYNIDYYRDGIFDIGAPVAAANGIVSISAGGDMIVNSVVAPRGGVFLESREGSIYAGRGFDILSAGGDISIDDDSSDFMPEYINRGNSLSPVDVSDTSWYENGGISFFKTYAIAEEMGQGPNVIAGGASYFSAPNGTIGVGTPDKKETGISGQIQGIVRPGVTAPTGVNPSPDIDLTNSNLADSMVYYEDTDVNAGLPLDGSEPANNGAQSIWPRAVTPSTLLFMNNPLKVHIEMLPGAPSAVPLGITPVAALTLGMGSRPSLLTADPSQLAYLLAGNIRKYYELLGNYRLNSMDPATPAGFYAYHPLADFDTGSLDSGIDEGAFEFIDGQWQYDGKGNPYTDDERRRHN
ncbi:MAG: hypothetical protein HQL18_05300, partial [Candidatus Omnitrophica bacterium]|nr:hypothetical protein [Candidatus Omnitrophota bacterium]